LTLMRNSCSAASKASRKRPGMVVVSRSFVACDGSSAWLKQRASDSYSPVAAAF
jgi:ribosomal protein L15E